jgi:hypothetical protein
MAQATSLPEPRAGLLGHWDRFIGPGATRGETLLTLGAAFGAAIALVLYAFAADLGWTGWQIALAALLALDLAGGVAANATLTTKRWYHRPGQGLRDHLGFIAAHIHPLIVGLVFGGGDWLYGLVGYGGLLVAALIILRTAPRLQLPIALLLYLCAVLIGLYALPDIPGMAWFVPVFYLKLLVAHLLPPGANMR